MPRLKGEVDATNGSRRRGRQNNAEGVGIVSVSTKVFYGTKRAALAPLSHFVTALLSGEPKSHSVKSQKKCFQAVPFRGKWLRHSRRRKGLFRMQSAEGRMQN